MKPVFCHMGGSMQNVCHISTTEVMFPPTWSYDPRQEKCEGIEAIREYLAETKAEFIMFGVRSNGIPNRAVDVNDTVKLDKALNKFEKVLNRWEKM